MTTVVSSTVRAQSASLDQLLGSLKQAHQLAGCRTCGLMSMFTSSPKQPAGPRA